MSSNRRNPISKTVRDPFRSWAARTYCDATAQITSSWLRQESVF